MRGVILRKIETAESPKSIVLGNTQRKEWRPLLSSLEKAKSFVNNGLRPVEALGFFAFILRSALRYAVDFGLSTLDCLHKITPSELYIKII